MKKSFRGHLIWDKDRRKFVPHLKKKKFSDVAAPLIANDEIEPTESYATAEKKIFTSKRKLFNHYREHGFRCTEGEDLIVEDPNTKSYKERLKEEKHDRDTVEQAFMDVKYDRVEFSEQEKENHKREEAKWGSKYKVKSPY